MAGVLDTEKIGNKAQTPVSEDLFRAEAIEAARNRLGLPVNNFGLKSWVLVGFMGLILITSIIFLCTARYAKKETVIGSVVPSDGVIRISTLRPGVIKDIAVKSGDSVKEGQILFWITHDTVLEDGMGVSGLMGASNEEQLKAQASQSALKQAQLSQNQAEALARAEGLERDIITLSTQREIQAQRVILLEKTVETTRKLAEQQLISILQLRQREDALLQAKQALTQLDQSINQTKTQAQALRSQAKASYYAAGEMAQTSRLARAQLEEKRIQNQASKGMAIIAQKAGRMDALTARIGDQVQAQQTLGLIVPSGSQGLMVQLWIPSRSVGFVEPGQSVRIMFDAFPYATFGVGKGKVVALSGAPLNPQELPIPIETREQMFRVLVALDQNHLNAYGRKWALSPGQRLSADLVLDERNLLDWLLDPLLATRQRMAS
jgi:membrane fusion protein